jgi:phage replication-related protein YjqB (UPF0714/DUF867 family)
MALGQTATTSSSLTKGSSTQVVSHEIPNFLQGVSQQNPVQRLKTNCSAQINFSSDVVRGLSKRPPTEYIADILENLLILLIILLLQILILQFLKIHPLQQLK